MRSELDDFKAGLERVKREEAFIERVKMGFTNFLAILAALLAYHWLSRFF